MTTKKTKRVKTPGNSRALPPGRTTLYCDISTANKKWLEARCKSKVGIVSKAALIERILHGLRTKPALTKQLGV